MDGRQKGEREREKETGEGAERRTSGRESGGCAPVAQGKREGEKEKNRRRGGGGTVDVTVWRATWEG